MNVTNQSREGTSKPILCLDTHELAWAAGFFDGEGCVGAWKRGSRIDHPSLTIAQSETSTLLRFQQAIVGLGNVRGPYRTNYPHALPVFQFHIHGIEKVQAAMAMLWPWLSERKRAQFKAAMAATVPYLRMRYEHGGKGVSKITYAQAQALRADHATLKVGRKRVPKGSLSILSKKYNLKLHTISSICQGYGYDGSKAR